MQKAHLKKIPTLTVIGLSGFVAFPFVMAARDAGAPKAAAGATAPASPPMSMNSATMRDPFIVERPPVVVIGPEGTPVVAAKPVLPPLLQDEDKILSGMRLGATFIDDREKLAVIDNKIYTRGDQLRGDDGSPLPYVITDISKDRALVRRGRRDFVIAFSNTFRKAGPGAKNPAKPAQSGETAMADASPVARARVKAPGAKGQSAAGPGDQKDAMLQLLSNLLGASAGGLPGSGQGTGQDSLGTAINASSIAAGLDALMGKNDDIGRANDRSLLSNPAGGMTP